MQTFDALLEGQKLVILKRANIEPNKFYNYETIDGKIYITSGPMDKQGAGDSTDGAYLLKLGSGKVYEK